MPNRLEIVEFVKALIAREMKMDTSQINESDSFFNLGLDSVNSVYLISEVETEFNVYVDPLSLFDNPTIAFFCDYLMLQIHE